MIRHIHIQLLFFWVFLGMANTINAQTICEPTSLENSCDNLRLLGFKIEDTYGGEKVKNIEIQCEEFLLEDQCVLLERGAEYEIRTLARIVENWNEGNNPEGQRMKIWLDKNKDENFEDHELMYDSHFLDPSASLHIASFHIPENLDIGTYTVRIRIGLIQSSDNYDDDFTACDFFSYSDAKDFVFHISEGCQKNIPHFEYEVAGDGCTYLFEPLTKNKNCQEIYQHAWSITPPDEPKYYIHEDGSPVTRQEELKKIGHYEICLQTISIDIEGSYCVDHHCLNYWNSTICTKDTPEMIEISEPYIYPTLIKEELQVAFATRLYGNERVEIFDIQGRMLREYAPSGHNLKIDVSYFPSGYYIVRISQGDKEYLDKMIKPFE